MSNKAYINNLSEEGSRAELIYWIKKLDGEIDVATIEIKRLRAILDEIEVHDT